MIWHHRVTWHHTVLLLAMATAQLSAAEPSVVVEVEEEVYSFEPADNGSGPMWCYGNTCIVRHHDQVFASALHTLDGVKPLNNCVPALLKKTSAGWEEIFRSDGRTREPSPLAILASGDVLMSQNPTTLLRDGRSNSVEPAVLKFSTSASQVDPVRLLPKWDGNPEFTDHSYRSFALDAEHGEFILFQNIEYSHAEWSFRDRHGNWSAAGKIHWPLDESLGTPIRVCYPAVALDDRRVYFFGASDIVEPNEEWLKHKREVTGREWDYVFRKLYYTWSDDITTGEFHDWVQVADVDSTGGHLFANDMWVGEDGDIAVLWSEKALDERLREKFLPTAKQRHALQLARIREGEVVQQSSVVRLDEEETGLMPGRGRFHETPDGSVWIVYSVSGSEDGQSIAENRLSRLNTDGTLSSPVALDLEKPFSSFFTNTRRAGCSPSYFLDMFGQIGHTMRYARIKFMEDAHPTLEANVASPRTEAVRLRVESN